MQAFFGILFSPDSVGESVRQIELQRTPLRKAGAFIILPIVLLLTGTVIYCLLTSADLPFFLRDAKAIYGVPLHTGALSSVGVLLWCTTGAVCLFASLVLHKTVRETEKKNFLMYAGLLTSVLMLDDLFLLHEAFAPAYLGVNESIVLTVYGLLVTILLARYRKVVYKSAYTLLALSLGLLASSIVLDLLIQYLSLLPGAELRGLRFLLEDGFKLLGIAAWFGYFGWTSYAALTRRHSARTLPSARQTFRPKIEQTAVYPPEGSAAASRRNDRNPVLNR